MWISRKSIERLYTVLDSRADDNHALRRKVTSLELQNADMAARLDSIQLFAAPSVKVEHSCENGVCSTEATGVLT